MILGVCSLIASAKLNDVEPFGYLKDILQRAAGFAGHSVAATLKLFQECGETFRDRLVGDIVLRSEPSPDCPQPWPSGQNVTRFGLARLTLPALAPTD